MHPGRMQARVEQAGAQVAEAWWHVLPNPQRPYVLSQVKGASSLHLGLYPTADRGRGLDLWWGGPGDIYKPGREWGGAALGSASGTPLTSVRPDVGLETVVILVFLATDSTLIGSWKTGKEGTGQSVPNVCNYEVPGPTVMAPSIRNSTIRGQGSSSGLP